MPTTRPFQVRGPFAAAATECPNAALIEYAVWWSGRRERRSVFAHPDEPPEVLEWIDAEARTLHVQATPRNHPARISFWLAFRVAGFLGGRLPRSIEWMLAAQDGKGHVWPGGRSAEAFPHGCFKKSQEHILPVAADQHPDVTEFGLSGITGNAREWTTNGEELRGVPNKYAPVCISSDLLKRRPSGRTTDALLCVTIQDLSSVDRSQGMRVFRDLITSH